MNDTSLRLRPLVSLLLFLSAYSPLMVILAIKDIDLSSPWFFSTPIHSGILLLMAVGSSAITLRAVKEIDSGLPVVITKAANKSGDMFGYLDTHANQERTRISFQSDDEPDLDDSAAAARWPNLPLAEPSPPAPAAKAAKSGRKFGDSRTTDLFDDGGGA